MFRIYDRKQRNDCDVSLLNLSVHGIAVIFSFASGKAEFCHFTGLKQSVVQESDQSIDIKFLFDRFALKMGSRGILRTFVYV